MCLRVISPSRRRPLSLWPRPSSPLPPHFTTSISSNYAFRHESSILRIISVRNSGLVAAFEAASTPPTPVRSAADTQFSLPNPLSRWPRVCRTVPKGRRAGECPENAALTWRVRATPASSLREEGHTPDLGTRRGEKSSVPPTSIRPLDARRGCLVPPAIPHHRSSATPRPRTPPARSSHHPPCSEGRLSVASVSPPARSTSALPHFCST